MPAKQGYLLSLERHTGSAWVTVADVKNFRLSFDPGAVDVTTHRNIDANDALHQVHIAGKRTTEITGEFIAHNAATNWFMASYAATGSIDARLRWTIPNLGTLEGYFLLRAEIEGMEDGAVRGTLTAVPSVESTVNALPTWTAE